MLPGVPTDDLAVVVAREVEPHEIPAVVPGSDVPSLGADGSPSRDRLARIAAMIHDAEHAATTGGVREAHTGRLIPLLPRGKRGRLRAAGAAAVDLAGQTGPSPAGVAVDVDVATVVQCELALLLPEVRRDPDRLRALLHPDFVEYGSSGRVWDRGSIGSVGTDPEPITAADLVARRMGPDAILLTYRSTRAGRDALRSSTWIRDDAGAWLLLFHQGTPVPVP